MRLRDRLWLLLSQAVNTLVFRGEPDESLSARAWREQWPKGRERIDHWLRWWGEDHCQRVYEEQIKRQQARRLAQ